MTIKKIATKAYTSSATALWGCGLAAALVLTGCSALPAAPTRPVLYDFGPGPLATVPTDRRAPLAPLALADMDAPGLPEGGNAVLYRLAYADAQQLRPYSQARWSQPPAQLLQGLGERQVGQPDLAEIHAVADDDPRPLGAGDLVQHPAPAEAQGRSVRHLGERLDRLRWLEELERAGRRLLRFGRGPGCLRQWRGRRKRRGLARTRRSRHRQRAF